ncbi:MAG: GNAT family N-acetyltransferase [Verrucomicrobia bacterium]|nr:MAG: GNAT family N-acetyltransferase [Verrucomicrobiota bacterium]
MPSSDPEDKLDAVVCAVSAHRDNSAAAFPLSAEESRPYSCAIPFPQGVAKVLTLAELKNCDAWRRAFQNKCQDHRYYEIVEETLVENDFEHHYLRLEDDAGNVRAIQPVFFVRQNLVEGLPRKVRSAVDGIRKIFPRFLTMRVLMVGCGAGTGDLGVCNEEDQAWTAHALQTTLQTYARQNRASLVVLKDFPENYRSSLETLRSNDYARIPSMPMTRLPLSYENWDEYFRTLSKATRKDLRRKFRKAGGAPKIEMEVVSEIAPLIDEIYPLYLAVHQRSPMKFETLTGEYFLAVADRMPERARFFIWRQSGKIVAFSFCLVCGDAIYDECIGLDYSVALDLHLYFYTLRDIISWALQQRLKYYYSNPLNYEPKFHLDCELVPLDLYVRHASALLNPIFRRVIKYLGPSRHEPVLKRFPNADRL